MGILKRFGLLIIWVYYKLCPIHFLSTFLGDLMAKIVDKNFDQIWQNIARFVEYIQCWSRVTNILCFRRKMEILARLINIYRFCEMFSTNLYLLRNIVFNLIWIRGLRYFNQPFHCQSLVVTNVDWEHFGLKRFVVRRQCAKNRPVS